MARAKGKPNFSGIFKGAFFLVGLRRGKLLEIIDRTDKFPKIQLLDLSGNRVNLQPQTSSYLLTAINRRGRRLQPATFKLRLNFTGVERSSHTFVSTLHSMGSLLLDSSDDPDSKILNDIKSTWKGNNPAFESSFLGIKSSFESAMNIAHLLAFSRAQQIPTVSLEGRELPFTAVYYLLDYLRMKETVSHINLNQAFGEQRSSSSNVLHQLLANHLVDYKRLTTFCLEGDKSVDSTSENQSWTPDILKCYSISLSDPRPLHPLKK